MLRNTVPAAAACDCFLQTTERRWQTDTHTFQEFPRICLTDTGSKAHHINDHHLDCSGMSNYHHQLSHKLYTLCACLSYVWIALSLSLSLSLSLCVCVCVCHRVYLVVVEIPVLVLLVYNSHSNVWCQPVCFSCHLLHCFYFFGFFLLWTFSLTVVISM